MEQPRPRAFWDIGVYFLWILFSRSGLFHLLHLPTSHVCQRGHPREIPIGLYRAFQFKSIFSAQKIPICLVFGNYLKLISLIRNPTFGIVSWRGIYFMACFVISPIECNVSVPFVSEGARWNSQISAKATNEKKRSITKWRQGIHPEWGSKNFDFPQFHVCLDYQVTKFCHLSVLAMHMSQVRIIGMPYCM